MEHKAKSAVVATDRVGTSLPSATRKRSLQWNIGDSGSSEVSKHQKSGRI